MSATAPGVPVLTSKTSGAGFGALLSVGGLGTLAYQILTTNTTNAAGQTTTIMTRVANFVGSHDVLSFWMLVGAIVFFPIRAGIISAIKGKPKPRGFWMDFVLASLSWTIHATNSLPFIKGTRMEEPVNGNGQSGELHGPKELPR